MPKSVVNWWCRPTPSSSVPLLHLPAETEHPDHPAGVRLSAVTFGCPSTNGAAGSMGDTQPISCRSLHRSLLSAALTFKHRASVWEQPCGLRDSPYSIQLSHSVQHVHKHFSFAEFPFGIGIISKCSFWLLCHLGRPCFTQGNCLQHLPFITVVYTPKAHKKESNGLPLKTHGGGRCDGMLFHTGLLESSFSVNF